MGPALENAQVHFQTVPSSSFRGNATTGKAGEWVTVGICVPQHLAQGLVHSWSRRGLASSERAGDLNPRGKGETSKGGSGLKLNSLLGGSRQDRPWGGRRDAQASTVTVICSGSTPPAPRLCPSH